MASATVLRIFCPVFIRWFYFNPSVAKFCVHLMWWLVSYRQKNNAMCEWSPRKATWKLLSLKPVCVCMCDVHCSFSIHLTVSMSIDKLHNCSRRRPLTVIVFTIRTVISILKKVLPRDSYAKRGICRRRVSVCLSVCVCVCLSHSGIVSKRLNVGSRK